MKDRTVTVNVNVTATTSHTSVTLRNKFPKLMPSLNPEMLPYLHISTCPLDFVYSRTGPPRRKISKFTNFSTFFAQAFAYTSGGISM